MNIFFLDEDPKVAATYHHDRHVLKMIVESAQLLCSAHHMLAGSTLDKGRLYKLTHKNHPMALWVREHSTNYYWLVALARSLCDEYTYRFSKTHKTANLIGYLNTSCSPKMYGQTNEPLITLGGYTITKPPLCMPEIFQIGGIIESYRNYYYHDKRLDKNGRPMDKYSGRAKPPFLI